MSKKKKTAAIRNCLGEDIKKDLLKDMSSSPFSRMVDGSNDAGLKKMFPINMCIFDVTFNRIVPKFFVMNMLEGKDASTGEVIFTSFDQQHVENDLLWDMVSAIRLDNTNANIGEHNFTKSIAIQKNPVMVISDYVCHILHNASSKAADALGDVVKLTVIQIEKSTDKWLLTCFKSILKISQSNYLQFCCNLPVKFSIFIKSSLTVSIVFSVYKQNFLAQ